MPWSDQDASGEIAAMAIGASLWGLYNQTGEFGMRLTKPFTIGNQYNYRLGCRRGQPFLTDSCQAASPLTKPHRRTLAQARRLDCDDANIWETPGRRAFAGVHGAAGHATEDRNRDRVAAFPIDGPNVVKALFSPGGANLTHCGGYATRGNGVR